MHAGFAGSADKDVIPSIVTKACLPANRRLGDDRK